MKWTLLIFLLFAVVISKTVAYHQNDYILIFERAESSLMDKTYMNLKTRTFKYNRTQAVVNATLDLGADLGNEIEIAVQGYKFQSNEYRLFPLVFSKNLCKMLGENEFGLQNIYKCGNVPKCPLKKGNYTLCNWFPDGSQFPPYIPIGSYMMEVTYTYRSKNLGQMKFYGTVKHEIQRK